MLFFPSQDFHWNAISGFQHCSFTPPGVINMAMENSRMIFPALNLHLVQGWGFPSHL
jgi:hypothetical protein